MKGKIISINISDKKGIVKTPIDQGEFIKEYGLAGDAHGGAEIRQISLLAMESIAKMEQKLGRILPHGSFAENLTTRGIELHTLPIGTRLQIGGTIQEVSQIGKQCHGGCAIFQKVGKCIMPLEGIFTRVIQGGIIRPGDSIRLLSDF